MCQNANHVRMVELSLKRKKTELILLNDSNPTQLYSFSFIVKRDHLDIIPMSREENSNSILSMLFIVKSKTIRLF